MLVDSVAGLIVGNISSPTVTVNGGGATIVCSSSNNLSILGTSTTAATESQITVRGTRYSGTNYAAVQINDYLSTIAFEGYNGSTFKKSAVFTSTITSAISGGAFDTKVTLDVLNQANTYQQFSFSGNGVFTALSVGFTPLTTIQIGTVTPFEGGIVYNTDVNRLQLYTGSAFESVATFVTVPGTSTSSGFKGQYSADANYAYICYDTNLWIRIAKDAW
jgi:hypothetical protein